MCVQTLGLPLVAQTGRQAEYLQDAWLLLALPRFSASFKKCVTSDLAIQYCARLTPENRACELRGLIAAAKLPGGPPKKGRELLILTLD